MKHELSMVAGLLLACTLTLAQNRVIDVREAHPGKDLTMEEAIYKGVGYARAQAAWLGDGQFILSEGAGEYFEGSVTDPLHLTPYKPSRTQKADAYVRGAAGYGIRLDGDSLWGEKDGNAFAIGLSEDRNIVYGGTMMRNEFGFSKGYEWAPNGHKIAFYRKDQSRVTDFPLLDIKTRTGELELIKYPMNGMGSELLRVGIYDFDKETTVWLDVTDFTEERYITNLSWSPDAKSIYAQVLDRSQHHMKLNQYDARDGHFVRTVLTEDNEAWVEPQDPIWFLEGRKDRFIYRTDNRDGYKNLYLVDTLGSKIQRFTAVDADVEYVTNDGQYVYYTSAQVSPVENHLFRQGIKKTVSSTWASARSGIRWTAMPPAAKNWAPFPAPTACMRTTTGSSIPRTLILRRNTPLCCMSTADRTASWYRTPGSEASACGKCSWLRRDTWFMSRTTGARPTAAPPSRRPSTASAARPRWKTRWWAFGA